MRAAAAHRCAELRSPLAVRPWQHVWEPLSGYLALGEKLLNGETKFADAWNFGPSGRGSVTVEQAARLMADEWPDVSFRAAPGTARRYEAQTLRLDCSKARRELGWHGVWSARRAFAVTAKWYRDYYREGKIDTAEQLELYVAAAKKAGLPWTK